MKYENSHDLLVSELEKNGWENGNKPTTMRDRFYKEFVSTDTVDSINSAGEECYVETRYLNTEEPEEIIKFIEQELNKEREEIVDEILVEQACYGEHEAEYQILQDIINTIKNRV